MEFHPRGKVIPHCQCPLISVQIVKNISDRIIFFSGNDNFVGHTGWLVTINVVNSVKIVCGSYIIHIANGCFFNSAVCIVMKIDIGGLQIFAERVA